jgi:phosphatidylserine/phosphatidylglycerophosphate/cardiolipin synthase-like enzyme/uncharacterized membrane protein YdjX (TVP38/TMEM64 family)
MEQEVEHKDTLLRQGRNCWRIASAKRASFLVDAASYFSAFVDTIKRAQRSVLIVGWDIDSRTQLLRGEQTSDLPTKLGNFLNAVVARRRGLHVHILCWDFAMVFALERELFPVFKFGRKTHRRIHFRLDGNHPVGACHHQKIVVVDDALAFVGGIDLTKERWDTPRHAAQDPFRADPQGDPYRPFHDVQMMVQGAAASALGDLIRERWRCATGETLRPPQAVADDLWPPTWTADMENIEVAIARTQPAHKGCKAIREVKALYLDMIARAQKCIYIENQYLTSRSIAEALALSLKKEDGPEVVAVLPKKSAGWLEEVTMEVARWRVLQYLRKNDRFNRLQVYYPVIPGLPEDAVNVHAKVMVVDDRLVRVGSSNLSNRSMGVDSECDLAIDGSGRKDIQAKIVGFRNRLLAEHLDTTPDKVGQAVFEEGSVISAVKRLTVDDRALKPLTGAPPGWIRDPVPGTTLFSDPEKPVAADELIEKFVPEDVRDSGHQRLKGLAFLLLIMLALAAAWRWTPLGDLLDFSAIVTWADRLREMEATPLIVAGIYLAGTLIMVPITLLILATAFVFGPLTGFLYAMGGSLLGAMSSYYLGHIVGRDTIRKLGGSRLNKVSRRLARHGIITIIALRVVPVAPFSLINIAAGASHILFRDFVLGTLLGMAPGILALTLLEHQVERAIRDPSLGDFALLGALVVGILLAAWLSKRWLAKKQ